MVKRKSTVKPNRATTIAVAGFLLGPLVVPADTLVFRNGNRVEGTLLSADNQTLRFDTGNHVNTYQRSEIDSLQFAANGDSNSGNPGSVGTSSNPNANTYSSSNGGTGSSYPGNSSGAPGSSRYQVPSGTEIVVRMIDAVDSQKDRVGQTYRCSIDQDVTVNGQTVIPRGADAVAVLSDLTESGKIKGTTSLTLDLKTVQVDGRTYDLVTNSTTRESGSRGARSAKVIGGTAALGAIIGAIAGGGKGAAIGAGSGAAVGTGVQVATSGQHVKVPAETKLSFSLQNSLDIQ